MTHSANLAQNRQAKALTFLLYEVMSSKDLLFRKYEDGAWYAHPIQVYLDLLRMEGRARDAANHLREERIRF